MAVYDYRRTLGQSDAAAIATKILDAGVEHPDSNIWILSIFLLKAQEEVLKLRGAIETQKQFEKAYADWRAKHRWTVLWHAIGGAIGF